MTNDENAFTAIYEAEYPHILAYCLKRTGNWHIAEDLTSAAFEVALRLLPHNDPRALLFTVARYEVLRYFRKEGQRRTWAFADVAELSSDDHHAALSSDGGIEGIVNACDSAMAAALLRAVLATCRPADLRIIELRYIQNRSAKDVAAHLGMTPGLYNKHQTRVLEWMAKRLVRHFDPALVKQIRIHDERTTRCRECGAPPYLRDLCRSHYNKLRRQERHHARAALATML